MTEPIEQEPSPVTPEVIQETPKIEIIDLIESPAQQQGRAFWYKIILPTETFYLTIIAVTSTAAKEGIKQQFPTASSQFLGVSEKIMQIQEQTVV